MRSRAISLWPKTLPKVRLGMSAQHVGYRSVRAAHLNIGPVITAIDMLLLDPDSDGVGVAARVDGLTGLMDRLRRSGATSQALRPS